MSATTKNIVEKEIADQGGPGLRKFADWLVEGFSNEGETLSHATVINWLAGKPPQTDFLQDMLAVYPPSDRRFQFALRMLAAKCPHVWGFGGVVWRLREKMPIAS